VFLVGCIDGMKGSYLAPSFKQGEMEPRLHAAWRSSRCLTTTLIRTCAQALAEGKAVRWFQGRIELGPRSPSMQSLLNLKVKYRESFRPFGPSVLREDAAEWFDLEDDSPYMLLTAFKELTGCPVLVNTSLNVRGEPIVCTPEDAFTVSGHGA
jgi:carbamoyltransferase